jgi:methylenetetrahydrofolate reductase (NADPH)
MKCLVPGTGPGRPRDALLADFSLGVIGKDIGGLDRARSVIPPGTRIYVGFVDSEDMTARVAAAGAVSRAGFAPVPIVAARRLRSEGMLRQYLAGLRSAGATGSVMVVAGDPPQPGGPYADAASVIGSGLLEKHGVREVDVTGYPGGHPAIADGVLWQSLADKVAALEERGLGGGVVTQFGFDASVVLAWLAGLRARGLRLPAQVGIPGPARVRQLLAYASWSGVAVTAPVAREYGLSLADPAATAAPGRFIRALAAGYDARLHGEVKLHFNSFGGIAATAEWVSGFCGPSGEGRNPAGRTPSSRPAAG